MKKLQRRALLVALMALPVAGISAEDRNTRGYATDFQGNILMDSYGNCVHSGSWTPELAIIDGCDGYTASRQAVLLKGEPIEGGVVSFDVPFNNIFEVDKTEISDDGKTVLAKTAEKLENVLAEAYSVTIIGHTDNTGGKKHNEQLSTKRAESVADYLASLGLPRDKLRTLGAGAEDPIAANDTKQGRAMNRRAEIVVVGQPRALDRMVMPSVALFPRRSAELSAEGKAMLLKSAQEARETFKKAVMIEVVGHTDDVGSAEYNMELSEARALAVGTYLAEEGVLPANRIYMVGAGKDQPVANNSTDEGRQENRRVEILVLGRAKR